MTFKFPKLTGVFVLAGVLGLAGCSSGSSTESVVPGTISGTVKNSSGAAIAGDQLVDRLFLPQAHAQILPAVRAGPRGFPHERYHPVDARLRLARLCLFQPQHPHQQRRGL